MLNKVQYDREFLTGTVDVLILSLPSGCAMHGYEILRRVSINHHVDAALR